ncbi:hypothetical protein SK128_005748 [Halocaridina rubra]|uniref:Major facilitator superfamily (MFS) profile domain-containing protein n=1 Tax=Halocaridina rubra TaxID=373956 RepID=A0AAN9A2E5_HALRR
MSSNNNKFDELLTQLGTGKWNFIIFFASSYWMMHLAPHVLGGAFLAPKVEYTCQTPEGGYTLTSTVVKDDGTKENYTNQCEYLGNMTREGGGLEPLACMEWQYDNATYVNTLTSEFDLVCSSEYLRATYQSMYMLGTFFGAPITGILADRYGRKTLLCIGSILYSLVAIGTVWLPNFPLILAARFIMGFLHTTGLLTGYILGKKRRFEAKIFI